MWSAQHPLTHVAVTIEITRCIKHININLRFVLQLEQLSELLLQEMNRRLVTDRIREFDSAVLYRFTNTLNV